MKVKGLDGKLYTLNLIGKEPIGEIFCSDGHEQARILLREAFPSTKILEELHLPGCSTNLYLDFFIPLWKIAVEVQGAQHKKYIPYFHKNLGGFHKSKIRDTEKRRWCQLNNIKLVEFHDGESADEWRSKFAR